MPLRLRPWYQVPFIKLLNWWEQGHTAATFGDKVIPRTGPPRCDWCFGPIDGHFHERDGQRFMDTGEVIGTPMHGVPDGLCSAPTIGNVGVGPQP